MIDYNQLSFLITGGTGTFGNAATRTLLGRGVKRICIYSRDEVKQAVMREAFASHSERLRFFLGDVRDKYRLLRATQGIDVILHAAALKRIESCDNDPREAFLTNVLGTQNVVDAALDNDVWRVIFISSDKACDPVTTYGVTKRMAESLIVRGNVYAGRGRTRLAATRYGNVLGSRGSVVELWQNQALIGDYVTVTDPDSTRFWFSIEEAVSFTLSCLGQIQGGETFIPKLKKMRVADLAEMVAPDKRHKIVGLRVGEKKDEVLVSKHEAPRTRDLDGRYVILPVDPSWPMDFEGLGIPVPRDFEYRSDTNTERLSAEEMRGMLGR